MKLRDLRRGGGGLGMGGGGGAPVVEFERSGHKMVSRPWFLGQCVRWCWCIM